MKAIFLTVGVLALAAMLGHFEPARASTRPVTSDEVRLSSEQTIRVDAPQSRCRNGMGNCRGGRSYGRGG